MIIQVATPQLELWRIEGEYSNLPHTHENEFQITVPIFGQCQFTLENRHYRMADGHGLVQHPKERHFFEIGEQDGILIFKVNENSMKELAGQGEVEFAVRQQFDQRFIRDKFRIWMNALLACGTEERLAQEELESQVLFYLFSALAGNHKYDTGHGAGISVPCSDRHIRKVLEHMHANFRNDIRIDDLASLALQSRYHFIRSFKAATGVTPYQYVLFLRMEEAKRLLKHSVGTITEISFSLGFSSVSQFQRTFVKTVGTTPTQFRKSVK